MISEPRRSVDPRLGNEHAGQEAHLITDTEAFRHSTPALYDRYIADGLVPLDSAGYRVPIIHGVILVVAIFLNRKLFGRQLGAFR